MPFTRGRIKGVLLGHGRRRRQAGNHKDRAITLRLPTRHNRSMRLRHTTIRVRILAAIMLVALATLTVTQTLVAVLHYRHVYSAMTQDLGHVEDEVRLLSNTGIDPLTGKGFTSAERVVQSYLERTVLSTGESYVAYQGTQLRWIAPADVELRPENDNALMAAIRAWVGGESSVITTVSTGMGDYRVLVAPVRSGSDAATLIRVIDIGSRTRSLSSILGTSIIVGSGTLCLVAAVAYFAVRRLLRPIEELTRAAESIGENDLTSRVEVRGGDDLALLARSFNRMLDRVETSHKNQLRLLDDVGHELRTPVTILRGHLEVLDPSDPEDIAATRRLLLEETQRMGLLIEDILLLAQMRQSDFLRPAPVAVAELSDRVFEKVRFLGERTWQLGEVADIDAVLDADRITQAWLQLVDNAVKYSAEGSRIALGSRIEGDELVLWVQDEGIGVAAEDLERVRRRFSRTQEAERMAPGSGLGLSIVNSIAEAHSGRLGISSRRGHGSVFSLRLPLRTTTEESET